MKANLKLHKVLSSSLAIIMISSTLSVPQNLILASQLSDINVIDDEQNKDESISEEVPDTENTENISEETSDTENTENISEETSDTENTESISEEVSDTENTENISEEVSDTENTENISEEVSDTENTNEEVLDTENINKPITLEEVDKKTNQEDLFEVNNNGTIINFNTGTSEITNLVIPAKIDGIVVTGIADSIFSGKQIKTLTFEKGSQLQYIGNNTFANTPIESVEFPDTLKTIGVSAFENTNLKSVNIPKSIVSIEDNAFKNSSKLEEVIIEGGDNASIGSFAFYQNQLLKSVKIGEGLTTIEEYAFQECSSLSKVEIPTTLTSIGSYAFSKCSSLSTFGLIDKIQEDKVIIPSNLTQLESNLFEYCGIKELIIEEGIEQIPANCFYFNLSLTKVTIPTTLKSIGRYGFRSCKISSFGLKDDLKENTIIIPDSLTDLQSGSFLDNNCDIEELIVKGTKDNPINISSTVFEGYKIKNATIGNVKNLSISPFVENVTIESAENIASYAFGDNYSNSRLKTITIKSVQNIESNAFAYCTLNEIHIPGDIKSIDKNAFEYSNIDKIVIDRDKEGSNIDTSPFGSDGIVIWKDSYNENGFIIDIDGYFQKYIGNETTITIPEKVNNKQGNEITVKIIGEYAFNERKVVNVTIPSSIEEIQAYAFVDNTLETFNIPNDSSLTTIGDRAFRNNKLTNVNLPEGLTTIGEYAFSSGISGKLKLPSSLETIGSYAFHYSGLTDVEIPNVSNMGTRAFYCCKSLKNVTFYEDTTVIPKETFYDCKSITNVTLPSSLKTIEDAAFYNCDSIKDLSIPENVTSIGKDAFIGVGNVWIDKEVDSISGTKWGAKVVYWKNTYPDTKGEFVIQVDDTDPTNITASIVAYIGKVPENTKIDLVIPEQLSYDEDFKGGITTKAIKTATITSISKEAFRQNNDIKTVTLPKTVKTIESYAFYSCRYLEEINLENVEEILEYSFYYTPLKEIDISNLKVLGDYSFHKSSVSGKLVIPTQLDKIGYWAFAESGINDIVIPYSSNTLNMSVSFIQCKNLETLTINRPINTYSGFSHSTIKVLNIGEVNEKIILGDNTFNTSSLETVNIAKKGGEIELGSACFSGTAIRSIDISSRIKNIPDYLCSYSELENITISEDGNDLTIGEYAFRSTNIEKIIIPSRVKLIEESAFAGCDSLIKVDIKGNTEIYSQAFKDCVKLEEITLGNLTDINSSTFENCKSLREIKIPNSVTRIDNGAFKNCASLSIIEIPESCTTIKDDAFSGCSSLDSIYINQQRKTSPLNDKVGWGSPNTTNEYFRGEYISTQHTKTERLDGENFNIELYHNGYGLTILGVTDHLGVKQKYEHLSERTTNHKITYNKLTDLVENKSYKFLTHGELTDPVTNQLVAKEYQKNIQINGFISYVDPVTKRHLSDVPVDKAQYEIGDVITIPNDVPVDMNQGLFKGYTTVLGDATPKYQPGDKIVMTSGNINLYAIFVSNQPSHTLTLVYGYDNKVDNYTVFEQEILLSDFSDTERYGYTFDGWYKDINFSGSAIDKITLKQNTTLYAKYTPREVEIIYHDSSNVDKDNVNFEDINYKLKNPSRNGYTFKGWFKDSENGININDNNLWDNVIDSGDKLTIDLYSKWSKKQETTTDNSGEDTSTENSTITTVEPSTETTTNQTQTSTTESSTEATTNNQTQTSTTEPSTEATTNNQTQQPTTVEPSTEATTNDNQNNQVPPIVDGGNGDNGGGGVSEPQQEPQVIQQPQNNNVYTFGNLQEITPEYEQLAREAIENITPNREAIDASIDNMLENASSNGSQINERRLTEKPAFGFGAEGNISLLIILLLLLVLIVIGYVVKKQIFNREKDEQDEDENASLES